MMSNTFFFLALSFGYLLQDWAVYYRFRKRYGSNLHRECWAGEGGHRWYLATIFLVSLYYVFVLLYVASGFDFWGMISPIRPLDRPFFHVAGFASGALFLGGIAISRLHLGAAWRVGVDVNSSGKLVTTGIYRLVRHPYFAALLGFELSLFFIVPCAVTLLAFMQSLTAVNSQAVLEDRFLAARHPDAYPAYAQRTGRFFPRFPG